MKLYFYFLFFLLFATKPISAQKAEKIYGKNKVLKSNEYYLQQAELWKKEITTNPSNADAWYNYYRANRNAYIVGEEQRSLEGKSTKRFERLNRIVAEMEKNVSGSFEFNHVKWMNSYNDPTCFHYLEKAYQLSPKRSETFLDFAVYYELKGDYSNKKRFLKEYYLLGDYSSGLLNFSYNMVSGLEKKAIILTEGDKDTEGTWILQDAKELRNDVKLLNVNFLYIKSYRERVFNELGIPPMNIDPQENNANYESFNQQILSHLKKNTQNRPVYAGVTLSQTYTHTVSEKLYCTGLAYVYSDTFVNSDSIIKKNYEEVYLLDYLKTSLAPDISEGNVHAFNLNYLHSLGILNRYYIYLENISQVGWSEELGHKIANDGGAPNEYGKYFGYK